jgi:hypothetical protein
MTDHGIDTTRDEGVVLIQLDWTEGCKALDERMRACKGR